MDESAAARPSDPLSASVAVIVPMHNALDTIARCLESVYAQHLRPQQVVVVDDTSTDGSADFVALNFPNVEVVRLPTNLGPGGARNAGVSQSQSEWIAFLDADDYWRPPFLESVVEALVAFDADFGSSGGIRSLGGRRDSGILKHAPAVSDATDRFWRYAMTFMPTHSSGTVVRRSLFKQAGGFDERARMGEDVSLWARLWLHGRFVFVNEALWESVVLDTGQVKTMGGTRYRFVWLAVTDLGRTLAQAVLKRRPGTAWFMVWYARMIVRRNMGWLRRRVRSLRRHGGARPGR
jgi:glycosyltransferase involved in cell wall biosynthesis